MLTEQGLNAFFYQNPVTSSSYIWAPLLTFVITLRLMWFQPLAVKIISPILCAFATYCTWFGFAMSWVLRDGLGVGMEQTHGPEAVAKFTQDIGPLLLFCGGLFNLGLSPLAISMAIAKWRTVKGKRRE